MDMFLELGIGLRDVVGKQKLFSFYWSSWHISFNYDI